MSILSSAMRGIPWLIGLQFFSRVVVTFALNRAIIKLITPEIFGIGSVQMQLLMNTILFLSRETFRRAAQRTEESDSDSKLKLARLSVYLGFIVCFIVCAFVIWKFNENPNVAVTKYEYTLTVALFGAAILLELLAEPLYITILCSFNVKSRVIVEGIAVTLRALVTFALISSNKVVSFGIGQLTYAIVILIGYGIVVRVNVFSLLSLSFRGMPVDAKERGLLVVYGAQTFLKYVLQEGEGLVLVALQSSFDQGVYGIAVNLGSLVLRLVFQPVEEITFTACSRAGKEKEKEKASLIHLVLKGVLLLGLFAVSWGSGLSYVVVRVLYGVEWSDHTNTPTVLSWYFVYVLTCSANGVTEAACQACGDRKEIASQNVWLAVNSIIFLTLCVAGVWLVTPSTVGLVWAGCVAMLLRTALSLRFLSKLSISISLLETLPHALSLLTMAATAGVIRMLAPRVVTLRLIAQLAALMVANLGLIALFERVWVRECIVLLKEKKEKEK